MRSVARGWGLAALLAVTLAGTAACTEGSEVTATPAGTAAETGPDPTTSPPTPAPTPAPTTTPGQASDLLSFLADARLAVVGVAHDDVLNVREGPGTAFPVLASLPPHAEDVVTTGRGWLVDRSLWIEVATDTGTGWAARAFLQGRDGTDDITQDVVRRVGSRPAAETMPELGRIVADAMASTEPPSSVVMSSAPSVGDLGEVSYDVVGLGDDSVSALRLHVFGRPDDSGDGFSLATVEATSFCARSGSTDDLCP